MRSRLRVSRPMAGGEAELETRHLEFRIAGLRASVRRLLALHGLGRVVGITIPLLMVVGALDWLIHFDSVVRLFLLFALGGCVAWLIYRFVITPLVVRFADLDIALRIEERWPGLNDRLASTVQFLKATPDDDRFGSTAMREATIRQTLEETKSIDFREVIETRPTRKALGLAAGAGAAMCAVVLSFPLLSGIAARRFFFPFGPDRWPRQTHLTLLDRETTRKVARGEPFAMAVAVAKGESAPSSARATYRYVDGEVLSEPLRSVEGGIFRGRIEAVEKSFTFSVAAGDDVNSIRDIAVRVVPPPAIQAMTVKLIHPKYTMLAAQTIASGTSQFKAVIGTRVEVEAVADKPLELATLRLGEKLARTPVSLDATRTKLKASFTLADSHPIWFDLVDTEGFKNREVMRFDARAFADEAPRVVIDEPTNDRDVPAQATVPIAFTVDDDFGIQSARLIYKVATGGSEPVTEVVLPLWDSGDSPDGKAVVHQQVRHAWDLAPLKLSAGSIISFHADARDFDSIKGPNLGKSRELRLRIVSDEEIARQIDDARRAIREETEAILAMENQAKTPVDDALRTLDKASPLNPAARENLKNAEMIQRQVNNRVTNKADGLEQKVTKFLDDLQNFRVANPDAQKQMQDMLAGVNRIKQNHLEPAEQGLTHASKNLSEPQADPVEGKKENKPEAPSASPTEGKNSPRSKAEPKANQAKTSGPAKAGDASKAQSPAQSKDQQGAGSKSGAADAGKAADPVKEALAEAQTNQKAIADELQKMLDGLSEFETSNGLIKDAKNLLKEQEQVIKQSAEAGSKPEMMGKTPEQLSPEQKADLANLAARQANVAKDTQGLQQKLDQMSKRTSESDPLGSSAMSDAAEQLQKKGTAAKAGEAADRLEKNQMGAARTGQEQTRQDLKDLVDSIQNRRERELAKLVKELKNAEAELEKIRERQTQNLAKTRAAQKNPDPKQRANELKRLAKEQAEIQKQVDSQLKRLAKLNAGAAAQAAAKASQKMGEAQESLDQGEGEKGEQDEDDALAELEDAKEAVKEARKEAEEQLAMEQLSKMGDRLKSMADRQGKVHTDTLEYEKLRGQREGKLSIPQRTGVRNLAGVQEALKDETTELIERLEGAPVFALTLKRASEGMTTAAERLQALKTDEPTQRAARSAAERFKQLLEAMKPDKPKMGGQQQGGGGGGGGGGAGGGGGDGLPPAAQLKMLKSLQQEINERTDGFDELKRRGKTLTAEQTAEVDQLQNDQGTLADLVRDLTKPKSDDSEE